MMTLKTCYDQGGQWACRSENNMEMNLLQLFSMLIFSESKSEKATGDFFGIEMPCILFWMVVR